MRDVTPLRKEVTPLEKNAGRPVDQTRLTQSFYPSESTENTSTGGNSSGRKNVSEGTQKNQAFGTFIDKNPEGSAQHLNLGPKGLEILGGSREVFDPSKIQQKPGRELVHAKDIFPDPSRHPELYFPVKDPSSNLNQVTKTREKVSRTPARDIFPRKG